MQFENIEQKFFQNDALDEKINLMSLLKEYNKHDRDKYNQLLSSIFTQENKIAIQIISEYLLNNPHVDQLNLQVIDLILGYVCLKQQIFTNTEINCLLAVSRQLQVYSIKPQQYIQLFINNQLSYLLFLQKLNTYIQQIDQLLYFQVIELILHLNVDLSIPKQYFAEQEDIQVTLLQNSYLILKNKKEPENMQLSKTIKQYVSKINQMNQSSITYSVYHLIQILQIIFVQSSNQATKSTPDQLIDLLQLKNDEIDFYYKLVFLNCLLMQLDYNYINYQMIYKIYINKLINVMHETLSNKLTVNEQILLQQIKNKLFTYIIFYFQIQSENTENNKPEFAEQKQLFEQQLQQVNNNAKYNINKQIDITIGITKTKDTILQNIDIIVLQHQQLTGYLLINIHQSLKSNLCEKISNLADQARNLLNSSLNSISSQLITILLSQYQVYQYMSGDLLQLQYTLSYEEVIQTYATQTIQNMTLTHYFNQLNQFGQFTNYKPELSTMLLKYLISQYCLSQNINQFVILQVALQITEPPQKQTTLQNENGEITTKYNKLLTQYNILVKQIQSKQLNNQQYIPQNIAPQQDNDQQLNELKQQNANYQTQIAQIETKLQIIEKNNQQLMEDKRVLQNNLDVTNKTNIVMHEQLQQQQQRNEELQTKKIQFENQLNDQIKINNEIQQQNQQVGEQYRSMKTCVNQIKSLLQQVQ